MKKAIDIEQSSEGIPVCTECGSTMIEENGEWACPHCQGEIDFFGDKDDK